jgi:hypothetical protein
VVERRRPWLALAAALASCGDRGDASGAGAGEPTAGPPWLEECAGERGIDFVHRSGHEERFLFPEIMGGGAALCDLDGDGDLDAYLVQSGSLVDPAADGANRLYANRGDGRFDDVTTASGAGERGYGMGVAAGDVDGDGDTDLYVTNLGANALLANQGGLRFADATRESGTGDDAWGTSAAFADLDADGDLDLFVANYVFWSPADELVCETSVVGPDYCSPKSYGAPAPDTLYRNEGDGRFADVSAAAGLRGAFGNGLGVLCADFDVDGRTDVFVANDGTVDQLWRNEGGWRFRDVALRAGCAVDQNGAPKAGMGVAAADLDDDGDEDLLVVNLADETDSLYRNDGGVFADRTAASGLALASRAYTRFGVGLVDLDQDGRLDLFEANGRVTRPTSPPASDPYAEPNLLFRGLSDGRFEEVLPRGGTRAPLVATSRGAAFGDVDGDGALDVLVVNRDAPAHLLRNVHPARGAWTALRVLDERGADALGAVVTARVGERSLTRVVRSAASYCSASDARVHLGLGGAEQLAGVTVRWPDGARERFGDLSAGTVHVLRRGAGAPSAD